MNKSVKNSKVYHLADVKNWLLTGISSLKKINRQVNEDLPANKINLNTSKTEIIIFRPKQKRITKHLSFRISGQKINTCSKARYLDVILEEHVDWNIHIRAVWILSKIRHYVPTFLLNTLYNTMFHSHLIYSNQILGQNNTILRSLEPLQNKTLRIINLKNN